MGGEHITMIPSEPSNRPRLLSQTRPKLQFLSDRLVRSDVDLNVSEGTTSYPPPVASVPQMTSRICSGVHCENVLPSLWLSKTCSECEGRPLAEMQAKLAGGGEQNTYSIEQEHGTPKSVNVSMTLHVHQSSAASHSDTILENHLPASAAQPQLVIRCARCSTKFYPKSSERLCVMCRLHRPSSIQPGDKPTSDVRPDPKKDNQPSQVNLPSLNLPVSQALPPPLYTGLTMFVQDHVSRPRGAIVSNFAPTHPGVPKAIPHFNALGELIDPGIDGVPHVKISKRASVFSSGSPPILVALPVPPQPIAIPYTVSPAPCSDPSTAPSFQGPINPLPAPARIDERINNISAPERLTSSPVMRALTPPPSTTPSTPVKAAPSSVNTTPSSSRLIIKLPARKKQTGPSNSPAPVQNLQRGTRVCEMPGCNRVVPSDSTAPRCDTCSLKRWREWLKGNHENAEIPRKGESPSKDGRPHKSSRPRKVKNLVDPEGNSRGSRRTRETTPRQFPPSDGKEKAISAPSHIVQTPLVSVPGVLGDTVTAAVSQALTDSIMSQAVISYSNSSPLKKGESAEAHPPALTTGNALELELDDLGELCYPDEEPTGPETGGQPLPDSTSVGLTAANGVMAVDSPSTVNTAAEGMDVDKTQSDSVITQSADITQPIAPEALAQISQILPSSGEHSNILMSERTVQLGELGSMLEDVPVFEDGLSDISELTPMEESTDSGETEIDPSGSEDESVSESRPAGIPSLKLKIPVRMLSAVAKTADRICNHPKCKNPLPPNYRWKLCVQCREKNRLYQRQRLGWDARKHSTDPRDDFYGDTTAPTSPSNSQLCASVQASLASRVCNRRSCKTILPADYRWKLCDKCRSKTRSSQARRRLALHGLGQGDESQDDDATGSDRGVPKTFIEGRYYRKRAYAEGESGQAVSSAVPQSTAKADALDHRVCRTPFCGIPVSRKSRSKFCDNCRRRTTASNHEDDETSDPDIPLSVIVKRKRKKFDKAKSTSLVRRTPRSMWAGFVAPTLPRPESQVALYQHFGALVKAFKARLSSFFSAQGIYIQHQVEQIGKIDSESDLPVIFKFDGEYHIVAYSWHHPNEVQHWADDTTKVMEDGLGLKFHLIGSFIAPGGAIVTRFHCQHDIIVPVTPKAPEADETFVSETKEPATDTAGVLVKRMAGELELIVLADRTHPFIPGQKIVVRFRMMGLPLLTISERPSQLSYRNIVVCKPANSIASDAQQLSAEAIKPNRLGLKR